MRRVPGRTGVGRRATCREEAAALKETGHRLKYERKTPDQPPPGRLHPEPDIRYIRQDPNSATRFETRCGSRGRPRRNETMRITIALLLSLLGCAGKQPVREISIQMEAPDGGWSISIVEAYRVGDEIWVISELSRASGMAVQAITSVSDRIRLEAPDLPVRHFVIGKTWGWTGEEAVTYIEDLSEVADRLERGTLLYRRPEPAEDRNGG